MKLKYLFTAIVSALLLTGCSEDNEPAGQLGNIGLSTTYAVIPDEGGEATVNITANDNWEITNVAIDEETGKQVIAKDGEPVRDKNGKATETWFTLSQLSGTANTRENPTTELKIKADRIDGGREMELQIKIGSNMQFLKVRQGAMEAVSASCAEVIAGADGKTYRVKGICTSIANTTYGNWYLNDGTGEVYIYGTLDANGGKQNFLSLNIEVGDEVELEGPKTTYSGNVVELVDVTVIKITKSLIKVVSPEATISKDGGELEVKVAYKGKGAYADIPADAQEWIRYKTTEFIAGVPSKIEQNPADTAVFKFDIMANVAGAREGKIAFNSGNGSGTSNVEYTFTQEGAIEEVTIADFLSREEGSAQYKISGIVTKIVNTTYGNIYIKDATGEAYIYGMINSNGQSKQFVTMGIEEGDVVTVVGTRSSYKGNPQMPNAVYQSHIDVTPISTAKFRNVEDSKDKYYMLTGKVEKVTEAGAKDDIETYGNFNLTDESGSVYVYGVTTGWNGERKKFGTLGVGYGDEITILAYKDTYKGLVEAVGIYVSHKKAE